MIPLLARRATGRSVPQLVSVSTVLLSGLCVMLSTYPAAEHQTRALREGILVYCAVAYTLEIGVTFLAQDDLLTKPWRHYVTFKPRFFLNKFNCFDGEIRSHRSLTTESLQFHSPL